MQVCHTYRYGLPACNDSPVKSVSFQKGPMLKKAIAVLLLVSVFACSKDKDSGSLPGELGQITKSNANCVCEPYVDIYLWNGQKVYFLGYRGPACNWIPTWYDKDGTKMTVSQTFADEFMKEAVRLGLVWKCN